MRRSLIALGSNLGDRAAQLDAVVAQLRTRDDLRVLAQSRWYPTRPVGGPSGQGEFLNGALLIETTLSPRELWQRLLDLERTLGRKREQRWGARTVDLDLLLYDDVVSLDAELELPHPRMGFRRFVLVPACEIAADMVHPMIGWPLRRILNYLEQTPPAIVVQGDSTSDAAVLCQRVADELHGILVDDPSPQGAVRPIGSAVRDAREAIESSSRRWAAWRTAVAAAAGRWVVAPFWPSGDATWELGERPRLLVVVVGSGAGRNEVDAWQEHARAHGVGPILIVDSADFSTSAAEIVAAALATLP